MSKKKIMRKGGPETCPGGPCSECVGAPHHFSDAMLEDEHTTDVENHEAITQGVEVWYQCAHCPAWLEYDLDRDIDDEDDHERAEARKLAADDRTLPLFGEGWLS